jgi:hypothetical protein
MRPPQKLHPKGPQMLKELYDGYNALVDYVVSLTPKPSNTVKPSQQSTGTTYHLGTLPGAATEEDTFPWPLGLVPRGEWSDEVDYAVNDLVLVYGGQNQGAYYAIALAPAGSTEPGTVGNTAWVKISDAVKPSVFE